jgi:hypothetical protein
MEIALKPIKLKSLDSTGLTSPHADLSDVLSPRKPAEQAQQSAFGKTVTLILSLVFAIGVSLIAVGVPLSTLNTNQLVR